MQQPPPQMQQALQQVQQVPPQVQQPLQQMQSPQTQAPQQQAQQSPAQVQQPQSQVQQAQRPRPGIVQSMMNLFRRSRSNSPQQGSPSPRRTPPQQQQPLQNTMPRTRGVLAPWDNDTPSLDNLPAHVQAAHRLLQTAAELPLPHRHRLLALAAASPDFRPLFSSMAAPASAQGPDAAPLRPPSVIAMQPVPDIEAKIQGLLRKAWDQVEGPTGEEGHAASPSEAARVGEGLPAEQVQAQGQQGPKEALALRVVSEYDVYGTCRDESVRAVVSLKAAAQVAQRGHVALTCVLDRSGSMSGERIALVQETCHFLIDQLSEDDYLGLISYSGSVRDDLPLVRMTGAAKALAHVVVEALAADGSTALYAGLEAGLRQQMKAERALAGSRVVHSCFLFTDGQATDGPTSAVEILAGLQRAQAPTDQHVTVHTFGFGEGHSVELLQAVAEAQSGVYYYIRTVDDIAAGFGDALGGLLSVVAKDVRLSVTPVEGVALTAFRSGGRTNTSASAAATASAALARGRAGRNAPPGAATTPEPVPTATAFNDVFAEESREVLVTFQLPQLGPAGGSSSPPPLTQIAEEAGEDAHHEGTSPATANGNQQQQEEVVDVASVELEYTDVSSGLQRRETAVLRVRRRPGGRGPGVLPAEVVFVTALRFETIDAIEEAQRLAGQGGGADVAPAHSLLDTHLGRLASAPLQTSHVAVFREQTQVARQSIKPRYEFTQEGVAAMKTSVQMLKQQRAATSTADAGASLGTAMYQNCSKDMYRKRASACVSLAYQQRTSAMPSNNNNNSGP